MWKSIFISLACTLSADAAAEGLNIKGVRLGMPLSELKQMPGGKFDCSRAPRLGKDAGMCYRSDSYAGVNTDIYYFLRADSVVSVLVKKLRPSDFESVTSALSEKFGAPGSTKHNELVTGMGVKVDNIEIRWIDGDSILVVSKYDSRIDAMGVTLMSAADIRREAEEDKTKAKSDL